MEPILLMADRTERPEHSTEAEPVVVRRDDKHGRVSFVLDDGQELDFDAAELRRALAA